MIVMTVLTTQARTPLDLFESIRPRSVDELRQALGSIYRDIRIEPGDNSAEFSALFNSCKLENVGLSYARYPALSIALGSPIVFKQYFVLQGTLSLTVGNSTAAVEPDQSVTVSPPTESHQTRVHGSYERIGLRLNPEPLTKMLSAMIGAPIGKPLRVNPLQDLKRPEAQSLRRLVLYVLDELSATACPPFLMLRHIEQALIVAFLSGNKHNYSHLLEQTPANAAPWQVRRVEEYIEAHWDQPINVADLATAAGVSARSVFRAFKKSRGLSPMDFVKQIRLRQAKQMFDRADAGTTVTDVAYACGFGDLGRFSREYCRSFGERPSEALIRAKGAGPLG